MSDNTVTIIIRMPHPRLVWIVGKLAVWLSWPLRDGERRMRFVAHVLDLCHLEIIVAGRRAKWIDGI